jgi:hypothetical protein
LSETSEDKTNRKLVSIIKQYEPQYTTSLFLTDYDDRKDIIGAFGKIRSPISRITPDITIIWYMRLLFARTSYIENVPIMYSKSKIQLPMIQLFTAEEVCITSIETILPKYTDMRFNLRQRKFNQEKWVNTVKTQNPHNLQDYFNLPRSPRRFNVTNKPSLNDLSLDNLINNTLNNLKI